MCDAGVTYRNSVLNMYFFFFKQKTAYEMRISDWSSDVCSSDLFIVNEGPKSCSYEGNESAKPFNPGMRNFSLWRVAALAADQAAAIGPVGAALAQIPCFGRQRLHGGGNAGLL